MKLSAIIIMLAMSAIGILANTRTTRSHLKAAPDSAALTARAAQLLPAADSLTVSRYDKPLRSSSESLFLSNRSRSSVAMVSLTIVYLSMDGEMLHSRTIDIPCSIPAGETRQLTFRAWDRQKAYYHHATRVTPRSQKAIPYRTQITVDGAVFE